MDQSDAKSGITMINNPLHKSDPPICATKVVRAPDRINLLECLPVINLIYDAFGDGVTSLKSLQEILNVMGLMSALMLACVLSFPLSFDNEKYGSTINIIISGLRWAHSDACVDFSFFDDMFIKMFLSAGTLLGCFVGVMFTSISLSSLDCDLAREVRLSVEKVWWRHNRFAVLVSLIELIVGVIAAMSLFASFSQLAERWHFIENAKLDETCACTGPVFIDRSKRDTFVVAMCCINIIITGSGVWPCKLMSRGETVNQGKLKVYYLSHFLMMLVPVCMTLILH